MTRMILTATAALALLAGCNKNDGGNAAAAADKPVTAAPVAAPGGDWTKVVVKTPEGGYRIGNADAKVQLVEYAAFSCPHCREFEEQAMQPLVDNYVKKGLVALEFRPFLNSPLDMPASLLARCNGESAVFGLTRALFAHQEDWFKQVQALGQEGFQALDALPVEQRSGALADKTGLLGWAAQNGIPRAKAQSCLADQNAATELVKIQSDGIAKYNIPGTPSFILNGTMVDIQRGTPVWTQVEAAIKAAL